MNEKADGGWGWGRVLYVVLCGQIIVVALWLYMLKVGFLFWSNLYMWGRRERFILCVEERERGNDFLP